MKLEQAWSVLAKFPQVELGLNPTPLHRMQGLEKKLNFEPIFIKRDDLNGLGIGGNKVRNLEFLLGDALAQGADTIIASGQVQSNLCALTAAACRKLGLDCILVHNNEKPEKLEGNAILNHLLSIDQRHIGSVDSSIREAYTEELFTQLKASGKKPYLIRNGASTPLGCLGYVQAACEILGQMETKGLPIGSVCVPGGNGGLAAGTIFGCALLDRPYHVDLITVEYDKSELVPILESFIQGMEELTGVRFPYALEEVTTIHEDFRCGGWGLIDDEVVSFLYDFAQTEGFYVEKVYTGKTLFGVVELVKRGYFDKGVCFLHSGGMGALFSQF